MGKEEFKSKIGFVFIFLCDTNGGGYLSKFLFSNLDAEKNWWAGSHGT
jgi:hypothetical protein